MRYKTFVSALLFLFFSMPISAKWQKVNQIDYTWGPFNIYNLSLFTETGRYHAGIRPIMLTLKYDKYVNGRDFAIFIAKSWSELGIELSNQKAVIEQLKQNLPDLKPKDLLHYIALEDRGYFVFNNTVLPKEFNSEFNNAILAIWLDPKSNFSQLHDKLFTPEAESGVLDAQIENATLIKEVINTIVDGEKPNNVAPTSPLSTPTPSTTNEKEKEKEEAPPVIYDFINVETQHT